MGTDGETIALDQKLARILVRPLARTALHPNWLTALGLGLGAVAAGLFALGIERTVQNLAVFVYVLAIFMDHTDGELARMTGKTSRAGHYFDHVQAVFNYTSVWVGMGIGLAQGHLGATAIWMGIVAGLGCAVVFGARLALEEIIGSHHVRQKIKGGVEPEDVLYLLAPVIWLGGIEYLLMAAAIGAPVGAVIVLALAGRDLLRHRRAAAGTPDRPS